MSQVGRPATYDVRPASSWIEMPKRTTMIAKISAALMGTLSLFICFSQPKSDTLSTQYIWGQKLKELAFSSAPHVVIQRNNTLLFDVPSLPQLLESHSYGTVRGYGISALQTISFRGIPGVGTQIRWNNNPINSPINGIFDLNLLPTFFLKSVEIQAGGFGGALGGGAVGGAIALQTDNELNSKIWIQKGSFGSNAVGFKWNAPKKITISFYYDSARNDYFLPKKLQSMSSDRRMSHSGSKRWGIQSTFGNHGTLQILSGNRQIPNSLTAGIGTAIQYDTVIRIADSWGYQLSKWQGNTSASANWEKNRYQDQRLQIDDENEAQWMGITHQFQRQLSGLWCTKVEATYQIFKANSPSYYQSFFGQRWMSSLQFQGKSLDSSLWIITTIRKEEFNNKIAPWIWDIFLSKSWNILKIKSHLSKVYRFPTLNDWLWNPGGNIHLVPETGYQSEIGITNNKGTINIFYQPMFQQILWLPTSKGYWQAENIGKSRTWGIEAQINPIHFLQNWSIYGSVIWQNPQQWKDQWVPIVYQPNWKIQAHAQYRFQSYQIELNGIAQGKRWITTDQSVFLPAQYQISIWLSKNHILHWPVVPKIGLINATAANNYYQPWLPGPRFQIQTSIQIKLK